MNDALHLLLAQPDSGAAREQFCQTLGCRQAAAASNWLAELLQLGVSGELLVDTLEQLHRHLPACPNPDRGLANLTRYIKASRSPQALLALFERDTAALPLLMRILATSQSWSEQLILDPESFDLLRITEGMPVSRGILQDELATENSGQSDWQWIARNLHTFKQRETMRIAFGDFIGALPIETVAQQLTILAEVIIETALAAARREAAQRFGVPVTQNGSPARVAMIGFGALGGCELSYSTRLELMLVHDPIAPPTGVRGTTAPDYFERIARRALQLISDGGSVSQSHWTPGQTSTLALYQVQSNLHPQTARDQLAWPVELAARYYENQGQTWQRMAFIKARHVAGDASLTRDLLTQLEPWVYRRYLSRSDLTEIAALKRQLQKRVQDEPADCGQIYYCPGGVRDIEFLIQYLQLLNGGELPEVRLVNTLEAVGALQRTGCLTVQEHAVLEDNYRFLRQVEQRLQIVMGSDAMRLPSDEVDMRQFLMASGFTDQSGQPAPTLLRQQLHDRTQRNSRILNHLLSETIMADSGEVAAETDLILQQNPAHGEVARLLSPYKFQDAQAAYRDLIALGEEPVSFLSSRRCRHFLAAIAPRLLQTLARTPAPDASLATLRRVSDSLGGKTVLWELFQTNQAALDLCVRLCATSPYLINILTSNPGMIDELIDSLMLDRLPGTQQIESMLNHLCHGVDDPGPVLHSFKNSLHLHIGVRDVLGKDTIVDTHRALSDVAEACLKQTIEHEYHRLIQKLGLPTIADGPRAGESAELIVLAVGKLGGREPNYHSDLDVLFLFDGDGMTRSLLPHRRLQPIANRIFFNQLGQRVVKSITRVGPAGHLYELDARLRPLGGGVGVAASLDDLENYFCSGPAQLWERQALCKARAIWASPTIVPRVMESVRKMLTALNWRPEMASDIQRHRLRLEQGAAQGNIKRGIGGTLDIEFLVQMLQLQHAQQEPGVLVPGTIDALEKLEQFGFLDQQLSQRLVANYRWLRRIESGLRLMNLAARHELPSACDQLDQLQFLLQSNQRTARPKEVISEQFGEQLGELTADPELHPLNRMCWSIRRENRRIFNQVFQTVASHLT